MNIPIHFRSASVTTDDVTADQLAAKRTQLEEDVKNAAQQFGEDVASLNELNGAMDALTKTMRELREHQEAKNGQSI